MIFMDTFYAYRIFKLDQHARKTSILWVLVFYMGKADENRAAVRYRRLENSKRKRRNFASRRDAERPLCSTRKNRQTSRVWRFSFRLKPPNIYPASVSPAPILTKVCEFFFGRFAHELGIGYVEFYIQRVVAGYRHPRNKRGSDHLFNRKLCRSIQRAPALQLL